MIQRERQWQPVRLGDDVPAPAGAYSPAAKAGGFVFVSGQVPRDPATGITPDIAVSNLSEKDQAEADQFSSRSEASLAPTVRAISPLGISSMKRSTINSRASTGSTAIARFSNSALCQTKVIPSCEDVFQISFALSVAH